LKMCSAQARTHTHSVSGKVREFDARCTDVKWRLLCSTRWRLLL